MPLIDLILKQLKSIASKLASHIYESIAVVLIGAPILVLWAADALDLLLDMMQTQVRLWEAITLVLLVSVCTYLVTARTHSSINPKVKFFTYCNMKWKVSILKDTFKVDKIPFCIEHVQQFVRYSHDYTCPETEESICASGIPYQCHDDFYLNVQSSVENKIRNKEKIK